jgi:hypothetical protein
MKTYKCLNCSTEHKHRGVNFANKYCDNKCQVEWQYKKRTQQWLEEGVDWGKQIPRWTKRWLKEQRGYACEVCGISQHNGKDIVLEVDHIDGHHKNNHPDNLRLICPNCHSQTDTYKAKNTGNGRKYR